MRGGTCLASLEVHAASLLTVLAQGLANDSRLIWFTAPSAPMGFSAASRHLGAFVPLRGIREAAAQLRFAVWHRYARLIDSLLRLDRLFPFKIIVFQK